MLLVNGIMPFVWLGLPLLAMAGLLGWWWDKH